VFIGRHGAKGADARPKPLHHHVAAGNRKGAIQRGQLGQQRNPRNPILRNPPGFRLMQPCERPEQR
jgi:hypothetical protein